MLPCRHGVKFLWKLFSCIPPNLRFKCLQSVSKLENVVKNVEQVWLSVWLPNTINWLSKNVIKRTLLALQKITKQDLTLNVKFYLAYYQAYIRASIKCFTCFCFLIKVCRSTHSLCPQWQFILRVGKIQLLNHKRIMWKKLIPNHFSF